MKSGVKKTVSTDSERLAAALQRLRAAQEQARVELEEVTRLTARLSITHTVPEEVASSNSARRTIPNRKRPETLLDSDLRIGDRVKVNNPRKLQPREGTVIGCDSTFIHVKGDHHIVIVKRIAANLTKLR